MEGSCTWEKYNPAARLVRKGPACGNAFLIDLTALHIPRQLQTAIDDHNSHILRPSIVQLIDLGVLATLIVSRIAHSPCPEAS